MVFSQLSAVLVPALCDEVSIDLVEDGGHRYRIRRPSSAIGSSIGTSIPAANGLVSGTLQATANSTVGSIPDLSAPIGSMPDPELAPDSVTVAVHAPEGGLAGPPFAGVVVCTWREGYAPGPADGALVRLMVDHAVALIQRERLTNRVPDLEDQGDLRAGEPAAGHLAANGATRVESRIDAAVGIVMSLHHLDQAQAIDMLVRLSHRARRQIQEVAETIGPRRGARPRWNGIHPPGPHGRSVRLAVTVRAVVAVPR